MLPRGGQRGTTVELTLRGERLDDAEALLFHGPGLEQLELKAVDGKTVRVRLAIAADCALGEHALRLRCRSGLSEVRTFMVGALRQVAEEADRDGPQEVGLEVTVEGTIRSEDQDAFAFEARAGQRITAEVEAMRLGGPMFDPLLVLSDASGRELLRADDHPLLGQDALLSFVAPQDGRYVVTVRDAAWEGSDRHRYRLHLGTFPRPTVAFPPGGRPGEALAPALLGDAAGPTSATIAALDSRGAAWVAEGEARAPSPLRLRLSPLPAIDEAAAVGSHTPPFALHGRIERAGEVDELRFQAAKGVRLRLRTWARGLGSPLDPVLDLLDAKGKVLGSNDDAQRRADAELVQAIPADGEYRLRVRDFQGRGGETFVYRVEVAPVAPSPRLEPASYGRNSQERNALVVPRGNRMAFLLRLAREGAAGPVEVALDGLPAGLAVVGSAVAVNPAGAVAVVVEAAPDAPLGAGLVRVEGRSGALAAGFRHGVALATGQPNDTVYHALELDRLAAAVVEPAPFRVELVAPRLPLVPGGVAELEVRIERAAGFERPVFVSLLLDPPGTTSRRDLKVEPKQGRATIPITASPQAAVGRWPLVVVARGEQGGDVWVSSAPVELAVEPPFLRAELNHSAGPQGGAVELAGELALERPLPLGEASARLIGLPAGCVAPVVSIGAASKALAFAVAVGEKAKLGKHRNIVCEVRIPHPEGTIVQRLAPTAFRVDPPAAAPPAPPPGAKPERPLTRLERLRAEHAARKAREEDP